MDKDFLSIGKTAKIIGVTPTTLRRWEKSGKIKPVRTPTGRRIYSMEQIESIINKSLSASVTNWASAGHGVEPERNFYCPNSAVFQYRLTVLGDDLDKSGISLNKRSLITAVVGEIGNNSYDHNLGNWPDVPGIFFAYDLEKREIAMADRGQGILKTLRSVKPAIKNEKQALKIAFTEIISGRAPENRGNGLKFVKEAVVAAGMDLYFQTGKNFLKLSKRKANIVVKTAKKYIGGCLAIIKF